MKKFLLLALICAATNAFSQAPTNIPLSKEQEKQVSKINKETAKQVNAVVTNDKLSAEEKKAQLNKLKNNRDAQARQLLTPEQISTFEANDAINWDNEIKKIDKIDAANKKAEMNVKLSEVNKQMDNLKKQEKDIKTQIDKLKKQQKDIQNQQKGLKTKIKNIQAQYK
ncbi:MAG: hypothetical protein FWC39_03510 [Bacteroidetes bacterium]|nr:hypothetical protein [Bacteroidota bacterium]